MLTPTLKSKIKKSLKTKYDKGDLDDYAAFKKEQKQAVAQYGADGFVLAIAHELERFGLKDALVFPFSDAETDNPWKSYANLTTEKAIEKIWKPFKTPFTNTLKTQITNLFVANVKGIWYLVYPYLSNETYETPCYKFLAGTIPNLSPALDEILIEKGWVLPKELADFYKVHSSFGYLSGVLFNAAEFSICESSQLSLDLAFIDDIAKAENWDINYSFHDLLPFFQDSCGCRQCFYKPEPSATGYYTVDWDNATKEVSGKQTLGDFLETQFGTLL